jgi:DNA recombination protein RmuC
VKEQTQTVLNTLDKAQTRSNVMHRALRQVEALPEGQVPSLLALDGSDLNDMPEITATPHSLKVDGEAL